MTASPSPDVIDCVLTSLPDFATLLSTILVSKSFHDVFRAHPSSILTSVAKTQIGSELLPCALRLAHFKRGEYLASRANYVQDFPLEIKFSSNEGLAMVTAPYVAALARNDDVVTELELLFSTTYKDRESGSRSHLNPHESLQFRRAFYRWWLMLNLLPAGYLLPARTTGENADDEGDDDTESDDDDEADAAAVRAYMRKSQGLRGEYFRQFSVDEVAEMWQLHNFMKFATLWTRNAVLTPAAYNPVLLLWGGPSIAAKVFRALRSFDEPRNHPMEQLSWDKHHSDGCWPGFRNYLKDENYDVSKVDVVNPWDPFPRKNVILDSRVEGTEECDKCHLPHLSHQMWSSSNWHLLPCAVSLPEVIRALPGDLCMNNQVVQPLLASPWVYTHFVDRYVSPGQPDWSGSKVLCKQCVLKLMGRRTLNSLRELKVQRDEPPLEDCWSGYNCRKQSIRDHATKLNHLCEPTRGD